MTRRFARLPIALGLVLAVAALAAAQDAKSAPRPLELQDMLAWKSIGAAALSADGGWFVYQLSPGEGESEVVVKAAAADGKEYRFPIGEAPRSGARPAMSEDGRWAAFLAYPGRKETRTMRKERKRILTRAVLVELATGEKTEFEAVRAFAFSGENPGYIALHRFAPEAQEKEKEKWAGSDLLLRELASGRQWNIGNVSEFAFDKKGTRLAWLVDAQGQAGNGLQIRDLAAGTVNALDADKAEYKALAWTREGEALAVLKGREDKTCEEKLFSLVAFTGFGGKGEPRRIVYDPAADPSFPAGLTISPNRPPAFSKSFDALIFGIHDARKKPADEKSADDKPAEGDAKADAPAPPAKPGETAEEDIPGLVLWHWKDGRLQSQQQVEESRDKRFSYLCVYRIAEKKFLRLADDSLRRVEMAPQERWAIGVDNTPYELDGNLDGRRLQDVHVVDARTGERRLALEKCRWFFGPSPDGNRFLYYDDGHFLVQDMATGATVNITEGAPVSFVNVEDDHNVTKPPVSPVGWVKGGAAVLLSDGWDVWNVPARGGAAVNLTIDGRRDGIRYQRRYRLDPEEEEGIDLAQPLYMSIYGEWTKKSGIVRLEKGKPGAARLLWDDAAFRTLVKAEKAEVYLYTRETYKDYPDYHVAGAGLASGRRLTEANPQQKDFLWSSGSTLVDFTSAKGDKLQAALHLPANYEKGKRYPAIVYIYEKLSQGLNQYTQPDPYSFNKSVYTSHGYAVLMPDIVYKINDPGMSSVWCVLPALEAAIATGVVDKDRVGLQGHSWGGYQSSFLVTQTDAFAATVTGAPLTNMISMYSSIYWNSGSANQPIFESSQGRFAGGYWDNIEAYTRNSPVYFADRVTTPLVILHNDKDGAVDWNQGIEYFNTLRRLKKPVVMLQYVGENHGLSNPANRKDYGVRMKEFFDHHLKGAPAPAWWTDGVSHLKLKDHLKERAKDLVLKEPKPEKPAAAEKTEKK